MKTIVIFILNTIFNLICIGQNFEFQLNKIKTIYDIETSIDSLEIDVKLKVINNSDKDIFIYETFDPQMSNFILGEVLYLSLCPTNSIIGPVKPSSEIKLRKINYMDTLSLEMKIQPKMKQSAHFDHIDLCFDYLPSKFMVDETIKKSNELYYLLAKRYYENRELISFKYSK